MKSIINFFRQTISKNKVTLLISIVLFLFGISPVFSSDIYLSGEGWKAWLDKKAEWKEDVLYLPSEIKGGLAKLPVNEPTGGWGVLNREGLGVSVPMTMDEYFLEGINTNTYEGVSWVWRTFEVPPECSGKIFMLQIDRARLRAEVYINKKLAAYDIVGETPFEFDISSFINYGGENTIAVRLTNPGGRRGWLDSSVKWGEYIFCSNGANFSALGNVKIAIHDQVYIEDVFVKNILPAGGKKVELTVTVNNTTDETLDVVIPVTIINSGTLRRLISKKFNRKINTGTNTVSFDLTLSRAELWTPDTPVLYNCQVGLKSKDIEDIYDQTFGLRVIQWLPGKSGEHNFYLNGERFFLKTAIDWGYYTPTGYYATPEMAKRSVEAAKSMDQNGISFHRKIGEPLVMKYADEIGLCIYEEPGGFHGVKTDFSTRHILEKIRRMVIRDRNHPSLLMYNLSNEDHTWSAAREAALRLVHDLDNSRPVVNSSGVPPDPTPHFRPYENKIRRDFRDQHTAGNRGARYNDEDFYQATHRREDYKDCIYYLGEVNSTTGPSNWFKVYESILPNKNKRPGYDLNIYEENHDKIVEGFTNWRLGEFGSGNIKTPADVTVQAGRGMMYIHGRHAQSIMCNNIADGYALNGWSPGPQSEANSLDWDSGILDEGRFIKGPPESFSYWIRPLQISISRKNGKYFNVNESAKFEVNLINQGKLSAGNYLMEISVTDGKGMETDYSHEIPVEVVGGDCFAQALDDININMDPSWHSGFITVDVVLLQGTKVVADGKEQVLLKNRSSFKDAFRDLKFDVINWPAAQIAIENTGGSLVDWKDKNVGQDNEDADFILAGDLTSVGRRIRSGSEFDVLLKRVRKGEIMIVKFDKYWAYALHYKGILSKPVTQWGGKQTAHWLGNGWGYLDHFIGSQSLANGGTIGTNSWEVPADPLGFYPFESDYPLTAYGLYMARPWLCKEMAIGSRMLELEPPLLVLLGVIEYGKGKIILNPCFHVDCDNAFTDMLFYNIIGKAAGGDW
jgi:beta-galactosidase